MCTDCPLKIKNVVVEMLGRLKGKRIGLELVKDYDSCVVNSLLPDLSC